MRQAGKMVIILLVTLTVISYYAPNEPEKTRAIITTKLLLIDLEWNTTIGGSERDYIYSLIQTSDGGYVLAGCTYSYGAGGDDMWLVKVDSNGQHEWDTTFGGTEYEGAYSLIQTSDGGFALAGYTSSYGAGHVDMWLVKTDVNGQYEWDTTFGGTENEIAYSLIQTSDGGFALAGDIRPYGFGNADMWLVKTDVNGQFEWDTTFGGIASEGAYSLLQTSDGGFALAGVTGSYGAGDADMWLVKTDANGHDEWDTTFGGTEKEIAYSLLQTSDGGFALAGHTSSYGAGDADMWLVKINAIGHVEWHSTFGGSGNEYARSLIQTFDGSFAIAGYTESYAIGDHDMWMFKITIPVPKLTLSWAPILILVVIVFSLLIIVIRERLEHS